MISAIILTRNEEKNIRACIDSVSWCDEILVIDDCSTDKTREIAKTSGAKIFSRNLEDDFANQRNFGIDNAKGDWILFIDADERASRPLSFEIQNIINDPLNTTRGYFIKRIDTMWEKKIMHGESGNVKLMRLGKKEAGRWIGSVHEKWEINGKKDTLKNPLLHFPHQTISEFLQDINHYTNLRANELFFKKNHVYPVSIIIFPLGKFFYNFFLKRGFMDGIPGLVQAVIMSFHSFLVRGKLWLLQERKK